MEYNLCHHGDVIHFNLLYTLCTFVYSCMILLFSLLIKKQRKPGFGIYSFLFIQSFSYTGTSRNTRKTELSPLNIVRSLVSKLGLVFASRLDFHNFTPQLHGITSLYLKFETKHTWYSTSYKMIILWQQQTVASVSIIKKYLWPHSLTSQVLDQPSMTTVTYIQMIVKRQNLPLFGYITCICS